jgi:serine/threonine-protein kinase PknG
VASDIYTIGRTLMVLATEFRGYQSTYVASLPPVSATPLFQQHDSLYRLLAKACAPDPADRFASADELRVQLLGVLREVVSARDADGGAAQHSTSSLLFESPTVTDEPLSWSHLPALRVDDSDPQAGWLRTVSIDDPVARLALLQGAPLSSPEVLLAAGRAALEAGRTDVVAAAVRDMLAADPWEWRAVWLSGLASLATDDAAGAQAAFNAVYGQVPGELAPKLALALACEISGEVDVAEALYATCARTDANYIAPAAFGLARIRATRGDLDGELAALDLVPPTSRAFTSARRQRAGLLAASGRGLPALAAAMGSIESLTIEPLDRAALAVDVLEAALTQVLADGPQPDISIAGRPAMEPALRDGLEAAYRELAGHAPTRSDRVRLVDRANAVRRWSLR